MFGSTTWYQAWVSAMTVSCAPERYVAMTSVSLLGAQRMLTQPLVREGRTVTVNGVTFLALLNSALISDMVSAAEEEDEENIKKFQKLLDMLEEDDDVQNVWHNWEE